MKRAVQGTWWLATVVGLVAGLGSACGAAEPFPASSAIMAVSGTIASVDPARQAVTLDLISPNATEAPQQMEFLIDGETAISKEGVPLTFDDLHAGDERVMVQYPLQEHPAHARSIIFKTPAGLHRVTGTVERVDLIKGELAVKPTGWQLWKREPTTAKLDEATLIAHNGERAYLTNLRVGDEVAVQYSVHNGQRVARFINDLSQGSVSSSSASARADVTRPQQPQASQEPQAPSAVQ